MIVPGDIGAMEVKHPTVAHPLVKDRPVVRPADSDLVAAAALIDKADRITIYGGEGCRGAASDVGKLSEALCAPVAFAYRGKDILEANNPNAVGMTGLLGWAPPRKPSAVATYC